MSVPVEIERVVCERTKTRAISVYDSFYMELRVAGTFVVRARIKKDVFEYLRDAGVEAHTTLPKRNPKKR